MLCWAVDSPRREVAFVVMSYLIERSDGLNLVVDDRVECDDVGKNNRLTGCWSVD